MRTVDARRALVRTAIRVIGALAIPATVWAGQWPDRTVLPILPPPFTGLAAQTVPQSRQDFPPRVEAPAGAPNIVLVLTDDVGFGAASTFGGAIPTPSLDRLAEDGLRYTQFHTTALCSPTRAALLTGRNHHAVGSGVVVDMATGYPGYVSAIPRSSATVAEILRQNGYSTAMFGKHHNVPIWDSGPAGPFDLWPTGLGFEYFFGFIAGETNQWSPSLFRGTTRLDNAGPGGGGDSLDRVLVDDAIRWIHEQKAAVPDKPFFVYYAPGSTHAPIHAPEQWIARFEGRFDNGWDALRAEVFARQKATGLVPADAQISLRPTGLPAWDSLAPKEQHIAARMMETYAGMLAYQDAQIGRMLDELERMDIARNTLVMFVQGDNGASSEGGIAGSTNWGATISRSSTEDQAWRLEALADFGGPASYGHIPSAWAWAMDAPFPWVKQVASHLGGTRNGLVVRWPSRITERGVRTQFHHVIDVLPTLLEAASVPAPRSVNGVSQQRIDGVSMAYSFASATLPSTRSTQYFELFGNRAIYHDGWWAGTTPRRAPWDSGGKTGSPETYDWELYNLRKDFTQAVDLAARHPDRLRTLQDLWEREADSNQVWPLDDRTLERLRINPYRSARREYVFWGPDIRLSDDTAPPIRERSFRVSADIDIPAAGGRGVLLASGGQFGGWSFYLVNGRPVADHASSQQPRDHTRIESPRALAPGARTVSFKVDYDGMPAARSASLTIETNGEELARGRVERPIRFQAEAGETFDIGFDTGTTVSDQYEDDGRFNGGIRKLTVEMLD